MSGLQRVITWLAAVAVVVTFLVPPCGYPASDNRVKDAQYRLYWERDYGLVTDSSRWYLQFLVIGVVWAALYFSVRSKGPS